MRIIAVGVRIRAHCVSYCVCIQLPSFHSPPFPQWILSMYFWNNEHRALLFVFPHQNRALVTEGSSSLVISALHWLMPWIPAGASPG